MAVSKSGANGGASGSPSDIQDTFSSDQDSSRVQIGEVGSDKKVEVTLKIGEGALATKLYLRMPIDGGQKTIASLQKVVKNAITIHEIATLKLRSIRTSSTSDKDAVAAFDREFSEGTRIKLHENWFGFGATVLKVAANDHGMLFEYSKLKSTTAQDGKEKTIEGPGSKGRKAIHEIAYIIARDLFQSASQVRSEKTKIPAAQDKHIQQHLSSEAALLAEIRPSIQAALAAASKAKDDLGKDIAALQSKITALPEDTGSKELKESLTANLDKLKGQIEVIGSRELELTATAHDLIKAHHNVEISSNLDSYTTTQKDAFKKALDDLKTKFYSQLAELESLVGTQITPQKIKGEDISSYFWDSTGKNEKENQKIENARTAARHEHAQTSTTISPTQHKEAIAALADPTTSSGKAFFARLNPYSADNREVFKPLIELRDAAQDLILADAMRCIDKIVNDTWSLNDIAEKAFKIFKQNNPKVSSLPPTDLEEVKKKFLSKLIIKAQEQAKAGAGLWLRAPTITGETKLSEKALKPLFKFFDDEFNAKKHFLKIETPATPEDFAIILEEKDPSEEAMIAQELLSNVNQAFQQLKAAAGSSPKNQAQAQARIKQLAKLAEISEAEDLATPPTTPRSATSLPTLSGPLSDSTDQSQEDADDASVDGSSASHPRSSPVSESDIDTDLDDTDATDPYNVKIQTMLAAILEPTIGVAVKIMEGRQGEIKLAEINPRTPAAKAPEVKTSTPLPGSNLSAEDKKLVASFKRDSTTVLTSTETNIEATLKLDSAAPIVQFYNSKITPATSALGNFHICPNHIKLQIFDPASQTFSGSKELKDLAPNGTITFNTAGAGLQAKKIALALQQSKIEVSAAITLLKRVIEADKKTDEKEIQSGIEAIIKDIPVPARWDSTDLIGCLTEVTLAKFEQNPDEAAKLVSQTGKKFVYCVGDLEGASQLGIKNDRTGDNLLGRILEETAKKTTVIQLAAQSRDIITINRHLSPGAKASILAAALPSDDDLTALFINKKPRDPSATQAAAAAIKALRERTLTPAIAATLKTWLADTNFPDSPLKERACIVRNLLALSAAAAPPAAVPSTIARTEDAPSPLASSRSASSPSTSSDSTPRPQIHIPGSTETPASLTPP